MRNKFFLINKNIIILVICCFLSVSLFFSKDIRELQYFRIHISSFFSFIFSPKQSLNNLTTLKKENNDLINQIKKISQENQNFTQRIRMINEHRDYDKKLNKLIPNHTFTPAKVLDYSLSNSSSIFNVNVGLQDGLSDNYKAVINYDGNLVGKTWVIADFKSQVHKITDRDFHVYVRNDKNVFGQFSYKSGKYGIIESVSKRDEHLLSVGDIFYTSHSSNVYPENIPVAKVVSIKNRLHEHELHIKVEILANLNGLRNVFIIE